jgi:hypothetical protein
MWQLYRISQLPTFSFVRFLLFHIVPSHYAPTHLLDCARRHFSTRTICPICKYQFKEEKEIHQIRLGLPRPPDFDHRKPFMDLLFVQASPTVTDVNLRDLFFLLRRQGEKLRVGTRFVLKQFLRETNRLSHNFMHAGKLLREAQAVVADLKKSNLKLEASRNEAVQRLEIAQQDLIEKENQLNIFRMLHESMAPPSPSGSTLGRASGSIDGRGPNASFYARRVSDVSADGRMASNIGIPPILSSRHNTVAAVAAVAAAADSRVDQFPLSADVGPPNGVPNYPQQQHNVILPTPATGRNGSAASGSDKSYVQEARHHGRAPPTSGGMTVNPSTICRPHPQYQQHDPRHRESQKQRRLPSESHAYINSEFSLKGDYQRHYDEQERRRQLTEASSYIHRQPPQQSSQPSSTHSSSPQNPYNQPMPTAQSSSAPSTNPYGQPEARYNFGSSGASLASTGTHSSGGGHIRDFNADPNYSFLNGGANGRHQRGVNGKHQTGAPPIQPRSGNYAPRRASS